jgi:hypothetical protein
MTEIEALREPQEITKNAEILCVGNELAKVETPAA